MAIRHDRAIPTQVLDGFPWGDTGADWSYIYGELEIRVWHPYETGQTAEAYFTYSAARHMEMWAWIGARYELLTSPELKSWGTGWLEENTLTQRWSRLAHHSHFLIGKRRSTLAASDTYPIKPAGSGVTE